MKYRILATLILVAVLAVAYAMFGDSSDQPQRSAPADTGLQIQ